VSANGLVEQQAARWLAARDAHAQSPEDEATFGEWLDADIRHRVAFLRLQSAWGRCDRLKELRPLDREVDAELLRGAALRERRPFTWAVAATVVVALIAGFFMVQAQLGWKHYETPIGGIARIVLEDGSVIHLNTNSEIRVRQGSRKREVRLLRGEGRFQVIHNVSRPFIVTAADTKVRATGTAFAVRLRESERIEVLVAEGSVAIASDSVPRVPPLEAGEAATFADHHVSVSRMEAQQIERRLAWTSGRLQFRGESLGEAVGEFNRYNRRQLRIADPSLAQLRVGGTFNATDPDSFAAALASAFNLRIDPSQPDAIVLQPP
jgi:transmembrane sensor